MSDADSGKRGRSTGFTRRFAVVGTSGSGKTTAAREISRLVGVPHVELDALWWQPGWKVVDDRIFHERIRTALEGDSWVVDGNYWQELQLFVLDRVQIVVWLDFPLWLVLVQVIKRTLHDLISQKTLHGGNQQTVRMAFSRKGIIWWSLSTFAKRRRRYIGAMQDPTLQHVEFVRLRSRHALRIWLADHDPSTRSEAG